MRFVHKQGTQLWAKDSRMVLVVLPVAHIFATGLESDVLPPYAVTIAAYVRCDFAICWISSVDSSGQHTVKPLNFSTSRLEPAAMPVM